MNHEYSDQEPTEEMILAGAKAAVDQIYYKGDVWDREDYLDARQKGDWLKAARFAWKAMQAAKTGARLDLVAKAIYEAQEIVFAGTDPGPFETWPEEDKESYRKLAMAALKVADELSGADLERGSNDVGGGIRPPRR